MAAIKTAAKISAPSGISSGKASDSKAPKTFTYNLRAADPGPDGFNTYHVIKFHPGDKHTVSEFGPEWLLRKEAPKSSPYEEKKKKKIMAAMKKGGVAEAPIPEQDWKHPWLITHSGDEGFANSFIARRETDKRTSLDAMIFVTLTRVSLHAPKADIYPGSRVPEFNKQLADIYGQCFRLVCGPAADIFSKKVDKKSRTIDAGENSFYDVTQVLSRVSSAALAELDELIKEEESIEAAICKEYAQQLKDKDRKYDLNGKICRYKVVDSGEREHCFFWVESNASNELMARPIYGDWFSARKDGMRRGFQDLRKQEQEDGRGKKKEQQVAPSLNKDFRRLLQKTEDARAKNEGREDKPNQGKPAVKKKQYEGGGEDALRQKWREESHTLDDDMDCQQCGDIDDDDYDNKMAAAGDDLAVVDMMRELDQDAPEEVRAEMSDSEGEEEESKEVLDEAGRNMSRIISGKPALKEEDKKENDDDDDDDNVGVKYEEDAPRKKEGTLSFKIPASVVSAVPTGSALPTGSSRHASAVPVAAPSGFGQLSQDRKGEVKGTSTKRPAPDTAGPAGGANKKPKPAVAQQPKNEQQPKQCPTEQEIRAAIEADDMMCIPKLIELFGIKKMPKEEQEKFTAIFKKVCIKTKKVIEEGPYKGKEVITVKKLAP